MTGGLVQLITYGSQDIFLTGTPQITFFKILYRRNTNFSTESIPQHLIGDLNFGTETTSIIDKAGDLIARTYLEIEIPKVDLLKNPSQWQNNCNTAQCQFEQIQEFYKLLYAYVTANTDIARKILVLIRTNNLTLEDVSKIITDPNFTSTLTAVRQELQSYIANNIAFDDFPELRGRRLYLIQFINTIDASKIFLDTIKQQSDNTAQNINTIQIKPNSVIKNRFTQKINTMYQEMRNFYLEIYELLQRKEKILQEFKNNTYSERYRFAWVQELGHAIIDQLDIHIGNQLIDRHTGDWLIVFNQLFTRDPQIGNYNKMIGNIPELTVYDDTIKNSYRLIIPFQFWFCRHTGLALPLIALRYHDVMFTIRLKDLSKVCYMEPNAIASNIANLQSQYNINIKSARLYVDYIFLDTDERRRFAQSTHEYLIEIVQYNEFDNIVGNKYTMHLSLSHPTKYIVWFVQPNQYRDNPDGTNMTQWNNFAINNDKSGYPIAQQGIRLNSYNRTDPHIDIKYYNYAQPLMYFQRSPTDGLNVYSFAIHPMDHQPSAAVNLSRIDDISIFINFTPEFVNLVNSNTNPKIETGAHAAVYAVSYNILRIMGGMAGLAFQNS